MASIRDTRPEDAAALSELIDQVAHERRYLAGTKGFPVEATASFIQHVASINGVHIVAEDGCRIIGWCDITPHTFEGMTHVARLGMGLSPTYRGKGDGRKLLRAAISRAFMKGTERIELEVFASNISAVKLYENSGFICEGRKIKARRLDDVYDDIILYALLKQV